MRLGKARLIDDVGPGDFAVLAKDLGMGKRRMESICGEVAGAIGPSLKSVGEELGESSESFAYDADELAEDMASRLEVVRASVSGTL